MAIATAFVVWNVFNMNREQIVFTTKAHVFQIDPHTKKNWKPCSSESVPVSIVSEPRGAVFRITASDGGKAIVNSVLVATSTFTKTSPKFGQWSDLRAATVFGLGFSAEADLSKVRRAACARSRAVCRAI